MFTIGIDLGTTASVVSYIDENGNPKIFEVDGGKVSTPSVVGYYKDGGSVVGRNAICNDDVEFTLFSMKRFMGNNSKVFGKTAVEFSADILAHLKRTVEKRLKKQVDSAIITVPAHFSDLQRTATKQAASIANIKVLRLINEPTAAAIAFGVDKQKDGIFAVYDFGGGTFDFSILRLKDGVFQVIATGGDNYLGGDDLDDAILAYNFDKCKIDNDLISKKDMAAARLVAKILKEQLCDSDEIHKTFIHNGISCVFELTKEVLKTLSQKIIAKTLSVANQVMIDAGVSSFDGIVLAGGMTKLNLVKSAVKDFFNAKKIYDDVNPESVVAVGAAIQADAVANKNKRILLIDVVPLSLGIETIGGEVDKIIHRNTPIPIVEEREYTTYKDNQTGIKFHVVQGERSLAKDCRSLATFELTGIPPMPAGMPRVIVEFQVDVNGLLTLKAYEKNLGISQNITVEPSSGLSNDDIASMLKNAYENTESDKALSRNITVKVECERMIKFWNAILHDLPHDAQIAAEQNIAQLRIALRDDKIDDAIHLKNSIENIYGQYLDDIISRRLSGQKIADIQGRLS